MLEAVIFDLDGTLVDSEQYGHRLAFNEAFGHFGLPDQWDEDRYRQLLATTGGERRLFEWLSSPESAFSTRPEPERRQMAQDLHRWKTDRFAAMAAAGEIPPRDGVFDWLDDLDRHHVRLAVATTGSRRWVMPLLDKTFGAGRFEVVVAGDDVAQRKPDPEAYLRSLERLGVTARQVVAVEDSRPGWESAANAQVTCAVVANEETDLASATNAAGPPLVLDGFGPAAAVIMDRFGVVKSGAGAAEMLGQLLVRAIMEP